MGLFDKLFQKKTSPDVGQVKNIITTVQEETKKPKGGAQSASNGAEIRGLLFSLIEKAEAEIGQWAIAFAEKDQKMMVHPKLWEEIRKQPDGVSIESSLRSCFPTPENKNLANANWPSIIIKYRSRPNTQELLREKSAVLAVFITSNLDIAIATYAQMQENAPELTEEQESTVRLEEAALWYRIIDELAYQHIARNRALFMDYFQDDLAHSLALQGVSPDLICRTMTDRTNEYGGYRKWVAEGNEGTGGTLLWEAAKHIGEPFESTEHPAFLYFGFVPEFLELLNRASVNKLLTGREA